MRRIIAILLTTTIALNSCVKQKLEETYTKQDSQIDKYVTSQLEKNETYKASYKNGCARLTTVAGDGEQLSSSGSVSFYYAGYTFSGSISPSGLFITNHQETAESAKWTLSEPDYSLMKINMADDDLLEGLRNGLVGVQSGEECEILFSGKYAFGDNRFGIIPVNSALAFKIWVMGVSND